MPTRPYDAILFDFDGTLAELTIDFAAMKQALVAEARRTIPNAPEPGDIPALEWIRAMTTPAHHIDTALALDLDQRLHAIVRGMETRAAKQGRLFPFTRTLLASLRRRGLRTAIITRNCSPALYTVFPDANRCADTVLSRDDVTRAKPDPQHVRAALDALGVSPGRALMVGDHMLDMETGRRAGTDAAGVLTGRCSMKDLLDAGAVRVASNAAELFEGMGDGDE